MSPRRFTGYHPTLFVFLLILISCNLSCSSSSKSDSAKGSSLPEIEIQLNWYPESEHGGFYAALVHGYFEDEGLNVKIRPGGIKAPVIRDVAAKKVLFSVGNADQVLLGRAQDADVVAVMTPMQHSPRCIMVHERSGITKFEQIKNMRLSVGDGKTYFKFMQKRLPLEGVKVVPFNGSIAEFLTNDDLGQQGYIFSEPFVAQQKGAKTHCLMVSDLGFDPYTSVLITHGDTIKEKRELVDKMVRASIKGWKKYLESPKETNEYIHSIREEMSMEALNFGADAIKPLCESGTFGEMNEKRWQTLLDQLIEIEAIKKDTVKASEAFLSTN